MPRPQVAGPKRPPEFWDTVPAPTFFDLQGQNLFGNTRRPGRSGFLSG